MLGLSYVVDDMKSYLRLDGFPNALPSPFAHLYPVIFFLSALNGD